jgi:hypothetical protein
MSIILREGKLNLQKFENKVLGKISELMKGKVSNCLGCDVRRSP